MNPVPTPATHPTESTTRKPRDGFLDAIRAIASVRVIVWHAYGAPFISWCIASMPAMFFVFGSLLAASCERRSYSTVLRDRLRRVLLPLWGFTLLTWATVTLSGHGGRFDPLKLASWLLPLDDPAAAPWEHGWLSSPLWFLRMLLWLLALSPLLLATSRRSPRLTLFALVTGVFLFDWIGRHTAWTPRVAPMLWWKLGDAALYGTFATAGFWHHRSQFSSMTAKRWLSLAAGAAIAAVLWRLTQPVPLGVVNNSHPLHLFAGTAWLSLAFAARRHITATAARPVVAGVVKFLTRRSITIYLWHTTVIAGVLWLLQHRGLSLGPARPVVYLTLIALGTWIAASLFGWIEDLAAGRRPTVRIGVPIQSLQRCWRPAVAGVLVIGVISGTGNLVAAGSTSNTVHRPPPIPSQQPPPPEFTKVTTPAPTVAIPKSKLQSSLNATIRNWRTGHDASGVLATVVTGDGATWSAVDGTQLDGKTSVKVDDSFDIASITKLMTAELVYRAADEGRIDLDAPLPQFDAMPEFPYSNVLTARLLLSHRSGLVNYRDTTRYNEDRSSITTPQEAVDASIREPLAFEPGTQRSYSSVNYLLLGFLLEQTYGLPYDDILRDELLTPLGLHDTVPMPSSPGEPSYSTAGTLTTMHDLTSMTRQLLRDHALIGAASFATMTDIDPDSALGAGTIGFCPCTVDDAGRRSFFSLGHYGSDTLAVYVPSLDTVVGLRVTDGIHGGRLDDVIDLATRLGQTVHDAKT
jgi:CubicO group peptidase (beta-lactamase class C family)/peptidoglycan/LPS O-acetylase OafA/YrhL